MTTYSYYFYNQFSEWDNLFSFGELISFFGLGSLEYTLFVVSCLAHC